MHVWGFPNIRARMKRVGKVGKKGVFLMLVAVVYHESPTITTLSECVGARL